MDEYLGDFLNGDALYALNKLLHDLRIYKFTTAKRFFDHPGCEDFLWALLKLFCCSESALQAGHVAFTISTLAEYNADALPRFVNVAKNVAKYGMQTVRCITEFVKLPPSNTSDFRSQSHEAVKQNAQLAEARMNIVGLVATFSEDDDGRNWLVKDPYFAELLSSLTDLFNTRVSAYVETHKYSSQLSLLWTVSNTALVFARLLLDNAFTKTLFSKEFSEQLSELVQRLVSALQFASFDAPSSTDCMQLVSELNEAAVALRLNAAFALGRICCHEQGVARVFELELAEQFCLLAARLVCTASVYVCKREHRELEDGATHSAATTDCQSEAEQSRARSRRRERHSAASRSGELPDEAFATDRSGAVFRVQVARFLNEDHSAEFKNACYALSTFLGSSENALKVFVDENKAHNLQLFDLLVLRLMQVLKLCDRDEEAVWFATILLREMVNHKVGKRAFRLKNFMQNLLQLSQSEKLSDEVREELSALIKRLDKLETPQFLFDSCTSSSNALQLRWRRVHDRNFNLPIRYKLFECSSEPFLLIREMQLDCITPLADDAKNGQAADTQKNDADTWNLVNGDACGKNECFYAVEGLSCAKEYIFRVQAVTDIQQSNLSNPLNMITKDAHRIAMVAKVLPASLPQRALRKQSRYALVPDEPRNLRVLAVTTSQIRVVWEPPAHPNGAIRKYVVQLTPIGGSSSNNSSMQTRRGSRDLSASEVQLPKTLYTQELNAIVSGLAADAAYSVSVSALNGFGAGIATQLNVQTLRYGPHSPQRLRFLVVGRHEVQLTWDPPQHIVGKLTRYEVSVNRRVVFSGVDTLCSVQRLKPNTEYKFVVCALTSVGRFDCRPIKRRTASDDEMLLNGDLSRPSANSSRFPSGLRDLHRKSLPDFALASPDTTYCTPPPPASERPAPAPVLAPIVHESRNPPSAPQPANRLLTRRRFSDLGSGNARPSNASNNLQVVQTVPELESLQVSHAGNITDTSVSVTVQQQVSGMASLVSQSVKAPSTVNRAVKLPNLKMRYHNSNKQPMPMAAAAGIDLRSMARQLPQSPSKLTRRTGRRRKLHSGLDPLLLPNKVSS